MKTATRRHWLAKTTPRYWTPRKVWRVRAQKAGESFQWILDAGRGDSSAMGRAAAIAEWEALRTRIVREEEAARANASDDPMVAFASREEEAAHYRFYNLRDEWKESGLAEKLTYDEYLAFREFAAGRRNATPVVEPAALPAQSRAFSELITPFEAKIEARFKATRPGLKTSEDLGRDRRDAYLSTLAHMKTVVGSTTVKGYGEHAITEKSLSAILAKYREACVKEMDEQGYSGHWVNERMKSARALVSYLKGERLVDAEPVNLSQLTEKFEIEPNANPIPVELLRELYAKADDEFRAVILLAINCGFRQSELATLEARHLKIIDGSWCVEKRRGKSGVPYAIPMFSQTAAYVNKYGNKGPGLLFTTRKGFALVHGRSDAVAQRWDSLRLRVEGGKKYGFESIRDLGASFFDSVNSVLTPLYLAQSDRRTARFYVGALNNETNVPQNMAQAIAKLENYLALPY